jgi:Lysyl oxidase
MLARNSSTAERVLVRLVPAAGGIALCAAVLVAAPGDSSGITPGSARLPDLDQELPWDLQVTSTGASTAREYRLGFASAVRNIGDGPLIVSGRRWGAIPAMTADQLVESANAPMAVVEGVGRLRYVESRDHEHWHLLDFERYELRRARAGTKRVTDRKTGFCLGDRYRTRGRALPAQPSAPRYTGRCGLGATGRLRLVEGISVGYGDDYPANLEGQSLPLAGLPAGRYVLVHSVNVQRRLRETYYGNNSASLLLRLQWRGGAPSLRVLRRCPETERCDQRGRPWRSNSGTAYGWGSDRSH